MYLVKEYIVNVYCVDDVFKNGTGNFSFLDSGQESCGHQLEDII